MRSWRRPDGKQFPFRSRLTLSEGEGPPADRRFARERSAAGLHASRDYLYRTARGERQHRSGVIPLDLLPRRCPVCHDHTIIGHWLRFRQAHDDRHEHIWVRRGICHPCGRPSRSCPIGSHLQHRSACIAGNRPVRASPQAIPLSKQRRPAKIRRARPIHPRFADGHIGVCTACALG